MGRLEQPPSVMQPGPMEASHSPLKPAMQMQPIVPFCSTSNNLIIKLLLRGLTTVLTIIALIILTTNTFKFTIVEDGDYYISWTTYKLDFDDFNSYRYMLFTIVLGLLYSIVQLVLTIVHLNNGKRVSNILVYVDFFGDLVLLYALASGAAAGFAISVDIGRHSKDFHVFFAKANATASMLLLGSVCSAVSLVFAAFGLEHRI